MIGALFKCLLKAGSTLQRCCKTLPPDVLKAVKMTAL